MRSLSEANTVLAEKMAKEAAGLTYGPTIEDILLHHRRCLVAALQQTGQTAKAAIVSTCSEHELSEQIRIAYSTPELAGTVMEKIGQFTHLPNCPDEQVLFRHFRKAIAATLDHFGEYKRAERVANSSLEELRGLLVEMFDIHQPHLVMMNLLIFRG
jgi:hypothetical protein